MTGLPGPEAGNHSAAAPSRSEHSPGGERWARLRRRYLSLGSGEFVAAAVFAVLFGSGVNSRLYGDEFGAVWLALGPLVFILVQAGAYWLIARAHLPGPLPSGVARVYRVLRVLNPAVLCVAAVGIAFSLDQLTASAVFIGAVWLFGVIEYINYYVIRLSYPVAEWFTGMARLSTPRLVRDIRAAGH